MRSVVGPLVQGAAGQAVSFESLVVASVSDEFGPGDKDKGPDAAVLARGCPKYACLRLRDRRGRELGQAVSSSRLGFWCPNCVITSPYGHRFVRLHGCVEVSFRAGH
jgi:hypothetical protein